MGPPGHLPESSPLLDPEDPPPSSTSYQSFAHRALSDRLHHAIATGKLGSGPAEPRRENITPLAMLRASSGSTFMLSVQAVWSTVVVLTVYVFADHSITSFSVPFWDNRFTVSSSVAYAVGWALFVLLGFFVKETSHGYREGQFCWSEIAHLLRSLVRHTVQTYPPGIWHRGGEERMFAHLAAYPIALKMTLRGERERDQLADILDDRDLNDVMRAKHMHVHCMAVFRAYLAAVPNRVPNIQGPNNSKREVGWGTRYIIMDIMDKVDLKASSACRIRNFGPAFGYVNHLRIFLGIWLFFLPLSLVKTSGWFTVLWSVLITYGIGMIFIISRALTEPYGFDLQDIKLNELSAKSALGVLDAYYHRSRIALSSVLILEANVSPWLGKDIAPQVDGGDDFAGENFIVRICKDAGLLSPSKSITTGLGVFFLWCVFILLVVQGVAAVEGDLPGTKPWTVYVPMDSSTTKFVGLAVFLVLGFWMDDAYRSYWTGLELWQAKIRTNLEAAAFQLSRSEKGTTQPKALERIFGFLAALPYAAKQELRHIHDVPELEPFLSPQDRALVTEEDDLQSFCLDAIYGFINQADSEDTGGRAHTGDSCRTGMYAIQRALLEVEHAIGQCIAFREFPISKSLTVHLHAFALFWLMLMPIPVFAEDGLFDFVYLVPIAYSILKLLEMGRELTDPFGCDVHDLPLKKFCDDIQDSLRSIFESNVRNPVPLVREDTAYRRLDFKPSSLKENTDHGASGSADREPSDEELSFRSAVSKLFHRLPGVDRRFQIACTVWAVVSVYVSYGLSFWHEDARRTSCRAWCSPIDVEAGVLVNIGFALFTILAFRASDSINRYEEGAKINNSLKLQLRNFSLELVQFVPDRFWHTADKERIVAHIAQIPLALRDALLGLETPPVEQKEGLLSDEDWVLMRNSKDPTHYCFQVVQAYVLSMDHQLQKIRGSDLQPPNSLRVQMLLRTNTLRERIDRALAMKRFPVVRSYTTHQWLFTALWLALVPLSMTAKTGFFTILWAPLISYGVLALEALASELVDPFGTDKADLPIAQMSKEAVATILEAIESAKWECEYHIKPSPKDEDPRLGTMLAGTTVRERYIVAHFSNVDDPAVKFGEDGVIHFAGPRKHKARTTLFDHMSRSVPWWFLLLVTSWTALVVVISYVTRKETPEPVRWWESRIAVSESVATYAGFAAFVLLGFYAEAAFARFTAAGAVWGDGLRSCCHALASQWFTLHSEGSCHDGDHDRVLAHIAALPLALKMEMRGSRDVRDLKGLLSQRDIGRVECADSMSSHCLDVVRSYMIANISRSGKLARSRGSINGNRMDFVMLEVAKMEKMLGILKFLQGFAIAPGFKALLNTMLGIWFIIIPFVLTEDVGWLSIAAVPLIAYGLLGMYAVAAELEFPLDYDLNDLDLDAIADSIVEDVLFVRQNYKSGLSMLLENDGTVAPMWRDDNACSSEWILEHAFRPLRHSKVEEETAKAAKKLRWNAVPTRQDILWLARHAVPGRILVMTLLWVTGIVFLSWRFRYQSAEGICESKWWCSRVAISPAVKEHIGFALFLLLGLSMFDSHQRYVDALSLWTEGIIQFAGLLSNRMFQSYEAGTWHTGDLERIAGHVVAFGLMTVFELRGGEDCAANLSAVLSPEDARRVMSCKSRANYCLDVVHGYLVKLDAKASKTRTLPGGVEQHWLNYGYLKKLRECGADCERMVRIPLPFGYMEHLRIFLVIWVALLPLGLVESQGPVTVLWVLVIVYGVLGIERWSNELADPFGHDISDVPLEELQAQLADVVQTNLQLFRRGGAEVLIHKERGGFPGV